MSEDDYDEPPDDDGPQTYSNYIIYTHGEDFDGPCTIRWHTNDNDDDGWPGGESDCASSEYEFDSVWAALEFTNGGTRVGVIGCRVTVILDDSIIYTERSRADEGNYSPYCEWRDDV
jgi:hypothetical protein